MHGLIESEREWIEAGGTGAFAMGTVSGVRTRRYHNVLMHAQSPSRGRVVLVNGFDAWLSVRGQKIFLFPQRYRHPSAPNDLAHITKFESCPWPAWSFEIPGGGTGRQELFVHHGYSETVIRWTFADVPASLFHLRPFLTCRDYHSLRRRDSSFNFDAERRGDAVIWTPYPEYPAVAARSNAVYEHDPVWYEDFYYAEEDARGYDAIEDAASPGILTWRVGPGSSNPWLAFSAVSAWASARDVISPYPIDERVKTEQARRESCSSLELARRAYIVKRGDDASIIAGYPWFTDWGRDTFIAMRGLCLATGRFDEAESILAAWSRSVSEGMLPNRFPDNGENPDYNSVDASLWFIIAAYEYLRDKDRAGYGGFSIKEECIRDAMRAILDGYAAGTRFGICMDDDGLLRAGEEGHALTWMDARADGVGITPRIGKPVEIQSLWLNALAIGQTWSSKWRDILPNAVQSFVKQFWDPEKKHLADVVDLNHERGAIDWSLRPNQVFAVGGLPFATVPRKIAASIVEAVERELLTPAGLRTLSPHDNAYRGQYKGSLRDRDSAYHQGTVWPWLMGPFVEAWLRVRDFSAEARAEARDRFLAPLEDRLHVYGLGHLSELADGDPPHRPRGCPFQAWSMGEYLRIRALCNEESQPERVWNLTT